MINHLPPIDMAMVKAIDDGAQRQIHEFTELPEKDLQLEWVTRTHRVKVALALHRARRDNRKEREVKKI